jgi:hypothetical protein
MKMIKENYAPPDKQVYSRGQSIYSAFIKYLLSAKPGTLAIECADMKIARGLGHAVARYLQRNKKYDVLRPRIRKDSPTSVKVWIINVKEDQ